MRLGCTCCGLSRRRVLKGGLAAGALAWSGGKVSAQNAAPARPGDNGVRAIDIHAHYYPQAYLDLIKEEGAPFKAEYRADPAGFSVRTPAGNLGPLRGEVHRSDAARSPTWTSRALQCTRCRSPRRCSTGPTPQLSHSLPWPGTTPPCAAHQAHPERFVVLATLPMLDPDRAVNELDRVAKLPGVRGVYLGTNIDGPRSRRSAVRADLRPHRGARPAGLPASAADHRRQAHGAASISTISSAIRSTPRSPPAISSSAASWTGIPSCR